MIVMYVDLTPCQLATMQKSLLLLD